MGSFWAPARAVINAALNALRLNSMSVTLDTRSSSTERMLQLKISITILGKDVDFSIKIGLKRVLGLSDRFNDLEPLWGGHQPSTKAKGGVENQAMRVQLTEDQIDALCPEKDNTFTLDDFLEAVLDVLNFDTVANWLDLICTGPNIENGDDCDYDEECTSRYCKNSGIGVGCLGTCTRKKNEGESCNTFHGNDAECVGDCTCGACTNNAGKNRNGKGCDNDGECTSGYCKGSGIGLGCSGTCTRKRNEGESCNALTGNDAECVYACKCGACTNYYGKNRNGKDCDNDGECTSGYCKGSGVGWGCSGTCTRKRNEGESCNRWTGNDAECVYYCKCGTCTGWRGKLHNGRSCDTDGECYSNDCGPWYAPAVGCVGTCDS